MTFKGHADCVDGVSLQYLAPYALQGRRPNNDIDLSSLTCLLTAQTVEVVGHRAAVDKRCESCGELL
jgi:hypothetical protein